jgi:transcriptional regulator with XRE-family HTH domain
MDELPIGRRVAYWRNWRKMSQQVFADQLGKSKSWVDKVERGVRRLDKFSVTAEIADVLNVDVQLLLGREPERRPESVHCIDQAEVAEIRSALERYDQISAFFYAPPDPPPLAEIRKSTAHAWQILMHAKWGVLTRTLPKLLREAQAADAAYANTDEGQEAAHLLGQVYQITSSAMRRLGELDLGWLAADRSIAVSQRAADQLLAGVATSRVANALRALGRHRSALEVNVNIANRLAPGGVEPTTPERLSVYGILLLQGAMAAACIGDRASMQDLLAAAEDAAQGLGADLNHYWTSFGPTNVQLHRVAALVELGDGGTAASVHDTIDPNAFRNLMPERRAHHFIDMSRGFAQIGDITRAGEMLLECDQSTPAEIRCRPIAHEVMRDVLRRTKGSPPVALADLAEQMGVSV